MSKIAASTIRQLILSLFCLSATLSCGLANAEEIRVAASVSPKNWLYFGFTGDSRRLVTYDEISGLRTWDATTGTLLTLGVQPLAGETGSDSAWALIGDTRLLGVTMGDHAEFLEVEIPSGIVKRRVQIHGDVRSASISEDGRLIAYAGERASDITLLNTETGQIVRSLKSPKDNYSGWYNPVFSRDKKTIAALYIGYSEFFLQVWSVSDGRLLSHTNVKEGEGLAVTSNGSQICCRRKATEIG